MKSNVSAEFWLGIEMRILQKKKKHMELFKQVPVFQESNEKDSQVNNKKLNL